MQPFGGGFGGFERERLERVRFQEFPLGFEVIGMFEDAGAGGDEENRERVLK